MEESKEDEFDLYFGDSSAQVQITNSNEQFFET